MAKQDNTITVDVHGLYVEDALALLREKVARAPKTTEKIIVIHGYNSGNALQTAVRRRLHGPRIQEVTARFGNDGESIVWLKRC